VSVSEPGVQETPGSGLCRQLSRLSRLQTDFIRYKKGRNYSYIKLQGVELCREETERDLPDKGRVQAEEVAEGAAGVEAEIDPVQVRAAAVSARAAGLKYRISGAHRVLLQPVRSADLQ
jgi:hypothetical protein